MKYRSALLANPLLGHLLKDANKMAKLHVRAVLKYPSSEFNISGYFAQLFATPHKISPLFCMDF